MTATRSVSQVKDWETCPYRYYLARIAKAWQRPAAWLPQGTAVHEAAEAYERSDRSLSTEDTQAVFRDVYAREVAKLAEVTPNLEYWYSSGPYRGEQDIERRHGIGLGQTARYVDYYAREQPGEVIWITPDGTPAIELRIDVDLDGVRVIGYIDQVVDSEGGPVVRDIKTGNQPGDVFQLATYGVALVDLYGVEVKTGDYWMGPNKKRRGGPTKPFDLTEMTREQVTAKFHEVDEGIKAGVFEPKPDADKCGFCPVRTSCKYAVS